MLWTNKNKLIYSLSESVTLVTSHANWIARRGTVDGGSLSRFFQHAWMVLGELDLLSILLPHDSGLWPQTSCLTTAFCKNLPVFVLSLRLPCLMPRKSLEEVKAHEREQIRLRTERRIAQLREEAYELELTEVFSVCALIYIALIVLFYANLYLR